MKWSKLQLTSNAGTFLVWKQFQDVFYQQEVSQLKILLIQPTKYKSRKFTLR